MINRFLLLLLLVSAFAVAPVRADPASVQIAWRLLDYIAVDYPGAVRDGSVISAGEFAEMTEFSASAHERIGTLPASGAKDELQSRAAALQILIASKAPAATVAAAARALGADLIKAYPVPLTPAQPLVFDRGRTLFAQSCASCHGPNGDGHGPAAVGLQPPPIAFTDLNRARERSVFALKQVIDQGLPGTSMASFATLPSQDRWDLALYVSAFAYPASAAVEGEQLWNDDAALRAKINLQSLINTPPATLADEIGDAKAAALTAYLRRNPAAVLAPTTGPLSLARSRLAEMLTAYAKGERKGATDLALSAYLDGFEPVEPILATRNDALLVRIESAMGTLRAAIASGRPLDEVRGQAATLDALFTDAEAALAPDEASAVSTFFGAFTILLREGLEALLIVVTMVAFLRQTGHRDVLPYVHGGWIAALGAGVLTWAAATYFIEISGASREMTEGFGSVFAAGVLLWVGIWMHGKSSAVAWQRYICDKLKHALNGRSAWLLAGLSFLVVYREVFETILFYAAIWHHGNGVVVLAGGLSAVVALLVIAWVMTRYSRALPIERFFAYSSALIAVLAVVLIGKGVAALQEAGYVSVHPLAGFPRIAALGLFPTCEGIIASLGMIVLLAIGFAYNRRQLKKKPSPTA
ncbi:MAG: cytochrome c/FTR1 family iron permease [Lacunisphaera sp.]